MTADSGQRTADTAIYLPTHLPPPKSDHFKPSTLLFCLRQKSIRDGKNMKNMPPFEVQELIFKFSLPTSSSALECFSTFNVFHIVSDIVINAHEILLTFRFRFFILSPSFPWIMKNLCAIGIRMCEIFGCHFLHLALGQSCKIHYSVILMRNFSIKRNRSQEEKFGMFMNEKSPDKRKIIK